MDQPPPLVPTSPSHEPPQARVYSEIEQQLLVNDESLNSPWDWSDFLDFNLNEQFQPSSVHLDSDQSPQLLPPSSPVPPVSLSTPNLKASPSNSENVKSSPSKLDKISMVDQRMSCENFLADLVPCACPEMDAILAAEDQSPSLLPPPPSIPPVPLSRPILKPFQSNSENLKSSRINSEVMKSSQSNGEIPKSSPSNSDKIRKRDPRMSCENFLAGIIPCACPEMDAMLAEEEEQEESGGVRKKRARTVRVVGSGILRCQVPGCEADISELKGYHKRHRVCLRCANASDVFLDGQSKRYCQQCGKFHILSDFDEGKRSCRRKLERHNNRRRRKPSDSKGSVERELQQAMSVEDPSFHETGKDNQCASSQAVEENLLETHGVKSLLPCSVNGQHVQSDSIGSGETQIDEDKEKYANSPSYCDDKSAFSSACPTGRISFKLYDWNPAEFPRRLRHQIFQWLASMPVELEGYVRPGCTILTLFIAMPKFMWVKLDEDPVACISDLVSPRSMLSGRDTFHVYLNSIMVSVMKGGSSVIKVKVNEHVPKLHYVHPICFEAGKPMQFVACGSNLLQPKFRFLVSLAGKYLKHDVCVSAPCDKAEDSPTAINRQLVNICVPYTECNIFGPGFIEVENESGLSNFIPILVADKEVCTEINKIQKRLDLSLFPQESQSTSFFQHEILMLRHKKFSGFISDVAWLLKDPTLETVDYVLTASQLQRFTCLLEFLIENKSTKILGRVLYYMKTWVDESVSTCVPETEMRLFRETMVRGRDILGEHSEKRLNLVLHSKIMVPEANDQRSRDVLPVSQFTNQGTEVKGQLNASVDNTITLPLLNGDVIMTMSNLSKERRRTPCNPVYLNTNQALKSRPLIFVIASAAVCFGICAAVLHPHKATQIVVTIRRCLLDRS